MKNDRQRYALRAAAFGALAHPVRLQLLHLLCERPQSPSELAELLGVSRPNVSQHLAVLRRECLVRRTRSGGQVLWEAVDSRLCEACWLIDEILEQEFSERSQALEAEV